ncbi:MAG TPA: SH3 domain-containing protein [Thermoanaerobaculia bacterium]|nr:SH3 domain-containing protein [Thermoanaerobaculia bacterium]
MKKILFLVLVAFAACSTPTPPQPEAAPQPQAPAGEKAIGTVKVTATMLNVRRDASSSSDIVAQVRRGERLALLSESPDWDRIRLGNGDIGFVSVPYVIREGAPARARRGCAADADYAFVKTPTPSFSDSSAHGIVSVEATVDAHGNVTATKVIDNTTGDESLATLAEREIREAKFSPPVRNCVPKSFIFTYKRSF